MHNSPSQIESLVNARAIAQYIKEKGEEYATLDDVLKGKIK